MACLDWDYLCSMARLQPKRVVLNLVVSDWFTLVTWRCGSVLRGTVCITVVKGVVAGGSCVILQRLKAGYTSLPCFSQAFCLLPPLPAYGISLWLRNRLSMNIRCLFTGHLLCARHCVSPGDPAETNMHSTPKGFSLWPLLGVVSPMRWSIRRNVACPQVALGGG